MAIIVFKDYPNADSPLSAENINNNFTEIVNTIYPVGHIVIKADNSDYSNWLGFTWERTLVGRVAVGIDSNDTDFNTIGKTGGSKYLQAHNHNVIGQAVAVNGPTQQVSNNGVQLGGAWGPSTMGLNKSETENTGTGNSGNLQPYQVVAYWKRVS